MSEKSEIINLDKLPIFRPLRPPAWYDFTLTDASFLDNDIHEIVVPPRLDSEMYPYCRDNNRDIHGEIWGNVNLTNLILEKTKNRVFGITSLAISEFPDYLHKILLTSGGNTLLSINNGYKINSNVLHDFFVDNEKIYLDNVIFSDFRLKFVFHNDEKIKNGKDYLNFKNEYERIEYTDGEDAYYDNCEDTDDIPRHFFKKMHTNEFSRFRIPEFKINYRLGKTYNINRTIQCHQEISGTNTRNKVWDDADYRERFQYKSIGSTPDNNCEKGRIINLLNKSDYGWNLYYRF
jgi:hypothetical protein